MEPRDSRGRLVSMTYMLALLLAVLLGVGAPTSVALGSADPGDGPAHARSSPVYVDSAEIVVLESYPVQVRLLVRGSIPTPCHETAWEVQELSDVVNVRLWSVTEPGLLCVQVLEPFELSIPLGAYEIADLPVLLNGALVGRIEVGSGPDSAEVTLLGAGWSFGMCLGHCRGDLSIKGTHLVLSGRDQGSDVPLYENRGSLTMAGQERLAAALEHLEDVALKPVYGCPDCADGGSAYVLLAQGRGTTEHLVEFGRPPGVLAELYELTMSMMRALESCRADELVAVTDGCVPYEGR